MGVPCVTLRENTERPVTITKGTNILAGTRADHIFAAAMKQLTKFGRRVKRVAGSPVTTVTPPLWDGRAAERIVEVLAQEA